MDAGAAAGGAVIAHALLPVALGALIGLSLGAIGGGGSILTVPILVYVMGQGAHAATATSLAIVGAVALVGAIPHWRAGRAQLATALPFGLAGVAGAFAGAWANHLLPGRVLLALFGALMIVVAARMLWPRLATGAAAKKLRPLTWWPRLLLAGLIVGVLTGFFGVGGGFLIVPALTLLLGLSMREAVGTSLIVIAINSAAGLTAHLRYGHLDIALTLLFALGGAAGAITGALLAGRLPEQTLQRAFAVFVAFLGIWLIVNNTLMPV